MTRALRLLTVACPAVPVHGDHRANTGAVMDAVGRTDARLHGRRQPARQRLAGGRPETPVDTGTRRRALGDPVRERARLHAVPPARRARGGAPQPGRGRSPRSTRRPARPSGSIAIPRPPPASNFTEGAGPHATPLIVGNRLFAAGSRREFIALDKHSGKVLWSHDLIKEYGAPDVDRGMANSPLLFNNTIILPIGGRVQAVGAFNPETGALLWKAGNVEYSPASPIVIEVDGQQQLVVFGGDRIAGLDPANGRELWNHPHSTDWGLNISTPVWSPSDHTAAVLVRLRHRQPRAGAAPGRGQDDGHRAVGAVSACACTSASIIRIGDMAYMSSGDFGPAFLTAHQREDRGDRVAGPRVRPRATALRRWQVDRPRRGRHARDSPPCRHRDSRCWRARRFSRTWRGRRRR